MSDRARPSAGVGAPAVEAAAEGAPAPGGRARRRDAQAARALLVEAARRRFARDGYQATTVRDVAGGGGVTAAPVNRYFTSKEGLFEACMPRSLHHLDGAGADLPGSLRGLVERICSSDPDDERLRLPLLLLLRSSGDERADRIRRATLGAFAEQLAAAAGRRADDPGTEHLLLAAQVAVGTLLGTVLLRSSTALEPLASADAAELAPPLVAAVEALLGGAR
ncbi:helix-turn-helix domain-containing protein [Pseudokineococcus sp. 5B2Z-1]|uniref:helix-turn-helix domain-containing protein n=1 Tax=Pseudokineococcus sp. 5B2Z-1 TaxID=3132744 RepID=UPI003097DF34